LIISFSGTDGSGKTTIINEVKNILAKTGIKTIYRHEYDYFFLKYLFKFAGKERVENRRKHFLSPTTKKTFRDKLWPYLVLLDAVILILWLRITKRKTIVILDRFLYDQLVSFEGLNVINKNDRLIRWLYLKSPSPDIKIILTVSSHIAYERKKATHDYPLHFYSRGNKRYLEIARNLQSPILNTDQSLSYVLKQLFKILFNNDKFTRTVINKWANNRVIYKVIQEYHLEELNNFYIESIEEYYKYKVKLLKKTLSYIQEMMKDANIKWLLFKSYMPFPYVPTYDIDIMINPSDKSKLISLLETKGIKYCEEEPDKINIKQSDMYTISVHLNVGWEGINYVSTDFLWKNAQDIMWFGFHLKIPGLEAEILSHVAHIFFELSYVRLSDALYLSELIDSGINWKEIYEELDYFGWEEAFDLVIRSLKKISLEIEKGIKLPYPLPYLSILKIFIRIITNDIRKSNFSVKKMKEYMREAVRYPIWRIGERIVGRAPFGELLPRIEE